MQDYRGFLKEGLERYFDISEDYNLGQEKFELFATFNQRDARYMLLKDVEVYAMKSNEYILHKKINRPLEISDIEWLRSFLDDNLDNIIQRDDEHMSSVVTVIFEGPMPNKNIQKKLSKFKYYKSFAFGLKGWMNTKVMLVDPISKNGITNKLGKGDLNRFIMS